MTISDSVVPQQLVPMLHVADVRASARFYEALGFRVERTWTPDGAPAPTWMWIATQGAHLMLAKASAPVVPEQQAVLFYLYVANVPAAHDAAEAAGLTPGRIEYPSHSPAGEFRVSDPSGYALMIRAGVA